MPPVIEFAQRTDPGRDPAKQVNEDACGYRETRYGHLAVVCDGMGGHDDGREASERALAAIFDFFENATGDIPPGEALRHAISAANAQVFALSSHRAGAAHPGSTVVAILLHGAGTEVAHVGDSRCYFLHAARIQQITKDHSLVQQLVDAGILAPDQAAKHPDANQISRALGIGPEIDVEVRPEPIAYVPGDAFVLCSDGLSDLVTEQEILAIVGSAPAAQAVGQLVDLANARGGHDNVTVQIMRARESSIVQPAPLAPTVVQTEPPDGRGAGPRGLTQPIHSSLPRGPSGTIPFPPPLVQRPLGDPTGSLAGGPPGRIGVSDRSAPVGPSANSAERTKRPWLVLFGVVLAAVALAAGALAVYAVWQRDQVAPPPVIMPVQVHEPAPVPSASSSLGPELPPLEPLPPSGHVHVDAGRRRRER